MAGFSPAKLRRSIRRNADTRVAIIDAKANQLARIFVNAENQLMRYLINQGAGPKITPVRAERLMADVDRIVQTELTQPATAWVQAQAPELYNLGITHAARSAAALGGVDVFDRVASEKVRQTFLTFTEGETYGAILDDGFKRWLGEMMATSADMVAGIRDVLTEGAILGEPNGSIVNRLIEDGRLQALVRSDGSVISAADRARAIVRTEGIRAVVQTEVAANRAAGLRAFIDVGVRDETTSGECVVSQRQPPHSLGWWQSSPMGVPPRHVANCRDELLAVDPATFTNADALAFGIVGYDQATWQLDAGQITPGETKRLEKEITEAEAKQKRSRSNLMAKGFKVGTR